MKITLAAMTLNIIKPDVIASHAHAFQAIFYASAGATGVFSRRSRWIFATSGRSPAITRRPAPRPGESATG